MSLRHLTERSAMTQTNLKSHSTTAKPTPEGTTPNLPARIDRKRGATLITDRFFPISHRTLEKWPLIWRHVNGKATCDTNELLAMAQARLDAAPPLLGGKAAFTNLAKFSSTS